MRKSQDSTFEKDMVLMDSILKYSRSPLTEQQLEDSALVVVKVVSAHAGKFYNGGVFTPDGMKKALPTWKGAPVLGKDHYGSSIGTVIRSEYRDISNGRTDFEEKDGWNLTASPGLGEEILYLAINDKAEAKKILNGQYSRMSTGRVVDREDNKGSLCSICGSKSVGRWMCTGEKNLTSDGYPKPHYYGDIYTIRDEDGEITGKKKAYAIQNSWSNVHVAFIEDGFSGDPLTRIEEIVKSSDNVETTDSLFGSSGLSVFGITKDRKVFSVGDTLVDSDSRAILDSLPSDSASIESSVIYPTGVEGKLSDSDFKFIKNILGERALSTSDRKKLPDNAFAGPERTFPAQNPSYVAAGLYILPKTSLPRNVKDSILLELRKREILFGCEDRQITSSLSDEEFAQAAVTYSLIQAGCLANDNLETNSSYVKLLSELDSNSIPQDRLVSLLESPKVGPNKCLPSGTELFRKASAKALLEDNYRGPIQRDALLKDLGFDPQKVLTTHKKEEKPMETTLQNVLDFLSKTATKGDLAKIFEDSKVEDFANTLISEKLEKVTGEKDGKIKELQDQLTSLTEKRKEILVDEIIKAKLDRHLSEETLRDRSGKDYTDAAAKLKAKSVDALEAVLDELKELPLPKKSEKPLTKVEDDKSVKDKEDKVDEKPDHDISSEVFTR